MNIYEMEMICYHFFVSTSCCYSSSKAIQSYDSQRKKKKKNNAKIKPTDSVDVNRSGLGQFILIHILGLG